LWLYHKNTYLNIAKKEREILLKEKVYGEREMYIQLTLDWLDSCWNGYRVPMKDDYLKFIEGKI